MTEKILLAVPSMGDGGLASERSGHFGRCDVFTLVEIAGGTIGEVRVIDNPPHEHGGCMRPVELLASGGVQAVVVAGMGARPRAGFKSAGIEVLFENTLPGVGDVVRAVIDGETAVMEDSAVCGGHGHDHSHGHPH